MRMRINGNWIKVIKLGYRKYDRWYFPNTVEGKIAANSCIAVNPMDRYFGVTDIKDKVLVLLHKSKEEQRLRSESPRNYACDRIYY